MFEIIIILALAGSVAAGLWDLKTTEVPDEIPLLMAAFGIFFWFVSMINTGDSLPFLVSISTGTLVGFLGYILYRTGKWGGADAFVFAAIAYMVPVYNGRIFIIDYIMNFVLVSGVYMLVYSLVLGLLEPRVFAHFFNDLKKSWLYVIGLPALYFAVLFAMQKQNSTIMLYGFLIAFMTLFWRYALVIEENVFKKRVPTNKLKPGDVLENTVWRGITPGEIQEIKRRQKYVVIKEGVRFIPAFAINLFITLAYGNVLFLIFPL